MLWSIQSTVASDTSAGLYKALAEQARDGLCAVEADSGRIGFANPAFARMLGYDAEALVGLPFRDLFMPEQRDRVREVLGRTAHTDGATQEFQFRRQDGATSSATVDLLDVKAEGQRFVVIVVRSGNRLPQPAQAHPPEEAGVYRLPKEYGHRNEAALLLDPAQDRVLDANGTACALLGFSSEELASTPISCIFPEAFRLRTFTSSILEQGRSRTETLKCTTRATRAIDVELTAAAIETPGGRRVVATIRDVTEHKQALNLLNEMAMLAEFTPNPLLRFDARGEIVFANRVAATLLGEEAKQGANLATLLPGLADVDLGRCIRDGLALTRETEVGQRTLQLVLRGIPAQGVGYLYSSDITQVKEMEQALWEASQQFNALVQASPLPIVAFDAEAKVWIWNPAAEQTFGWRSDEVLGHLYPLVPKGDEAAFNSRLEHSMNGEMLSGWETKRRRKDGASIDVAVWTAPLRDAQGDVSGVLAVVADISERKREHEELVRQMREVAVLEERNRMARELHDTLAQGLAGIVLHIEATEADLNGIAGAARHRLARAKALAKESLQEARRSLWNLLPRALEHGTIVDALAEEVRQFAEPRAEKASFSVSGVARPLPQSVMSALLRICQEALINARRYARATEVKVTLAFSTDAVSLQVRDNGVGFDAAAVEAPSVGKGLGLLGMRERARLLGGTLTVSSTKEEGTTIEVVLPTP
ncbi:MAG: PAS domain S-box protein [Chloroflexi bacterium]|nr:PAS domain S-box protein [Chloroflexota bacterium]